jgi:hypothetical protein
MILSWRLSHPGSPFQGLNICLIRDWIQPIDFIPNISFKKFDESIAKLRGDTQATKIISHETPEIADWSTAQEYVLFSMPEKIRKLSSFYTAGFSRKSNGDFQIISNTPPWVNVTVETESGDFFDLTSRRENVMENWWARTLGPHDLLTHFTLFSKTPSLLTTSVAHGQSTYRLSRILEESLSKRRTETMSLKICDYV